MSDKKFSYEMHDQTERPGASFPLETHQIITHRYHFAGELVRGKRTLEIGCGAGMGLAYLKDRASGLVAGEYSDENINVIRHNGNDVCPLLQMDAHKLPFADHSFDAIVSMAMVYYLDMPQFLAEVRRVLKPDGVLFFDTSNQDMPGFWPSPYINRYYSVPELAAVLEQNGFTASFKGVFPAAQSLAKRKVKALVKNAIKMPLMCLPGGKALWGKMRGQAQAEGIALPQRIGDLDCSDVIVNDIAQDKNDRTHKVVYVTARPR